MAGQHHLCLVSGTALMTKVSMPIPMSAISLRNHIASLVTCAATIYSVQVACHVAPTFCVAGFLPCSRTAAPDTWFLPARVQGLIAVQGLISSCLYPLATRRALKRSMLPVGSLIPLGSSSTLPLHMSVHGLPLRLAALVLVIVRGRPSPRPWPCASRWRWRPEGELPLLRVSRRNGQTQPNIVGDCPPPPGAWVAADLLPAWLYG
jgi:hypothetical protein